MPKEPVIKKSPGDKIKKLAADRVVDSDISPKSSPKTKSTSVKPDLPKTAANTKKVASQPKKAEVKKAPPKEKPVSNAADAKKVAKELSKAVHREKPSTAPKAGGVLLKAAQASNSFKVGDQMVEVLKTVDVDIPTGDFVIIFGPSGSGKSTLLHLLLGLEAPTSGVVSFMGNDMYTNVSSDERADLRKKYFGMVFQQSNWIKAMNVIENIAFPLQLLGTEKERALAKAQTLLDRVGLGEWANYHPTELSSGQQQRASLLRAIIHDPFVIIADEPTGNLDYDTGQMIMSLLKELNEQDEKTIIMVTHDLEYLDYAKTAVEIFDGEVAGVYQGAEKEQLRTKIREKLKRGAQ